MRGDTVKDGNPSVASAATEGIGSFLCLDIVVKGNERLVLREKRESAKSSESERTRKLINQEGCLHHRLGSGNGRKVKGRKKRVTHARWIKRRKLDACS